MAKEKIIFIMDESEAYLRDEAIRIGGEWGFEPKDIDSVTEYDKTVFQSPMSLFGGQKMTHLDLYDKNDLNKFVKLITDRKKHDYFDGDNWFGVGLIITTKFARGSKKIENLVKEFGGEVVKKAKPDEMRKKLLGRLNLNNATYRIIDDFVGDNYDMLLSVVNEVEKLPIEEQQSITADELLVRLPAVPGAVPPWEYTNALLAGDCEKAIDLFERSVVHSHVLVSLALAKPKLDLLYRVKVLQMNGVTNSKEIGKILGSNIVWTVDKIARRLPMSTVREIARLTSEVEDDLKGGSNVDPNTRFKTFIANICLLVR